VTVSLYSLKWRLKCGTQKLYDIKFKGKTLFLREDGQNAIIGKMIDLKPDINLSK
jgi:hypothetical protein